MNSETCVGDNIGKQLAQGLPFLSTGVDNGIRGQHSTEILLKPEGDSIFERKLHWRCAEFSGRNSSQVGVLGQGLIVLLSCLDGRSRCSRYIGQSNRVVRRRRSGRAVLRGCGESAKQRDTEQHRLSPASKQHLNSFPGVPALWFAA